MCLIYTCMYIYIACDYVYMMLSYLIIAGKYHLEIPPIYGGFPLKNTPKFHDSPQSRLRWWNRLAANQLERCIITTWKKLVNGWFYQTLPSGIFSEFAVQKSPCESVNHPSFRCEICCRHGCRHGCFPEDYLKMLTFPTFTYCWLVVSNIFYFP